MTEALRTLVPSGIEIDESVLHLCKQLEAAGWRPRKIIGGRAVAYWPDGNRGRQIRVDLSYPINQNKNDFYKEHTQIDLVMYEESDLPEEG